MRWENSPAGRSGRATDMAMARDPVIVALDLDEKECLVRTAGMLRGEVETVKIGLEAFTHLGPDIMEELGGMGFKVFADLKLHDIPNTVSGAVRGLVKRGACMITVHVSGGRKMLEAAAAARDEAHAMGAEKPLLLGVTVLTSLDDKAVAEIGYAGDAAEVVLSLARLGMGCGLDGVVASAREVAALRAALGSGAVLVTPGIRTRGAASQDQARTASPAEALSAGADYLVVGRQVISRADPAAALRDIREAAGVL